MNKNQPQNNIEANEKQRMNSYMHIQLIIVVLSLLLIKPLKYQIRTILKST
ncbi:hypothetical protein [Serpentinicella alkaliphila]|uniref:hypothetical protein n=1 Tax=Serpentinicella alkaliphila TaxID=1734049 RepID=UPI0014045529|nr:hypothetical protein [Serpentinicella alkaliphila]